jgi:hypothetical protein
LEQVWRKEGATPPTPASSPLLVGGKVCAESAESAERLSIFDRATVGLGLGYVAAVRSLNFDDV